MLEIESAIHLRQTLFPFLSEEIEFQALIFTKYYRELQLKELKERVINVSKKDKALGLTMERVIGFFKGNLSIGFDSPFP